MHKDIVIIGAGPGGYTCAIRAAQLGANVLLVEKSKPGGVCLNQGCIPTKVLYRHASLIRDVRRAADFGVNISSWSLDYTKVTERKEKVVSKLTAGIRGLLKKNGVELLQGTAEILSRNSVRVTRADGTAEDVSCDYMVIATGSKPAVPPISGMELEGVLTSTDLLELKELPRSLVVIGGGVVGVEFAGIFNEFGCKVDIVELTPQILPGFDEEISLGLKKSLERGGVGIHTGCRVLGLERAGQQIAVKCSGFELLGEKVLVCTGRKPVLPASALPFTTEKGALKVNKYLQTDYENIYCIGDANGQFQLAHVAEAEAMIVAENILSGNTREMSYETVPSVVFSFPEVACVGRKQNDRENTEVGMFSYAANGKALCMEESEGFAKVVTQGRYREIAGMHILGHDASHLIAEAALAMKLEATTHEVANTIHAHPTLSEILLEACEDVSGKAIHK